MGGGKYRPPNLQIIFTGFYKHKSNEITPGWDCSMCKKAKPEPYCHMHLRGWNSPLEAKISLSEVCQGFFIVVKALRYSDVQKYLQEFGTGL